MSTFTTPRPKTVEETIAEIEHANSERMINKQLLEEQLLLEQEEIARQKELMALNEAEEVANKSKEVLETMAQQKRLQDSARAILEAKRTLPEVGRKKIIKSVIFDIIGESLWIDKDITDQKDVIESMVEELDAIIEKCDAATGTNFFDNMKNTKLLSYIEEVSGRIANIASERILTEAEETKEISINFGLTSDEANQLEEDIADAGIEEISNGIKEKVLSVIKSEREESDIKSELFKELDDAFNEEPTEEEDDIEGEEGGEEPSEDEDFDETAEGLMLEGMIPVEEKFSLLPNEESLKVWFGKNMREAKQDIQEANKLFDEGNYEEAKVIYERVKDVCSEGINKVREIESLGINAYGVAVGSKITGKTANQGVKAGAKIAKVAKERGNTASMANGVALGLNSAKIVKLTEKIYSVAIIIEIVKIIEMITVFATKPAGVKIKKKDVADAGLDMVDLKNMKAENQTIVHQGDTHVLFLKDTVESVQKVVVNRLTKIVQFCDIRIRLCLNPNNEVSAESFASNFEYQQYIAETMVDQSVQACIEAVNLTQNDNKVLRDVDMATSIIAIAEAKALDGRFTESAQCYKEGLMKLTGIKSTQFTPGVSLETIDVFIPLAECLTSKQFYVNPVTKRASKQAGPKTVPDNVFAVITLLEGYCNNMISACRRGDVITETTEELKARLARESLNRRLNSSIGSSLFESIMMKNLHKADMMEPTMEGIFSKFKKKKKDKDGEEDVKPETNAGEEPTEESNIQNSVLLQSIFEYTVMETFNTLKIYNFNNETLNKFKAM